MTRLSDLVSLDTAADNFRDSPTVNTAKVYQQVALEYAHDYMIAASEYAAIIGEIHKWLKAR